MTLRIDAPFWAALMTGVIATACITLLGVAAQAGGLVG